MKMKVILLSDVVKVGKKLDIKEVAAGFARNFLFPKRLAELATKGAVETIENRRAKMEAVMKKKIEDLGTLFEGLEGKKISIVAKANEEGHLFAGIHKEDVKELLMKELAVDAPVGAINMERSIKELGEHEIILHSGDKKATLLLNIEREAEA